MRLMTLRVFTFSALLIAAIFISAGAGLAEESELKFRRTYEPFDNNVNGWETYDTSMASARIENGKYYIDNKGYSGALFILHHADFPLGREFTIETAIKTIRTSDSFAYGFVLGASDASNNYVFQVSADNFYTIKKYQGGVSLELAGGKIREMVLHENSFNALKMEKQGGTIRFYINDYYISEVSNISLFGKRVGFLVEGISEVAIDYTRSQIWPD